MAKVIKRETKIEVRFGISPEEREPYSKDLVTALGEIEQLEADKKVDVATFNEKIKSEQAKVDELCKTLKEGKPVLTDVIAHFNFSAGTVKYADAATGKFYKELEREITDEDRQLNVGDEEGTNEEKESTTAH